jgi:hypothetical protein
MKIIFDDGTEESFNGKEEIALATVLAEHCAYTRGIVENNPEDGIKLTILLETAFHGEVASLIGKIGKKLTLSMAAGMGVSEEQLNASASNKVKSRFK